MKDEEFTCSITPEDHLLFEAPEGKFKGRVALSVWQDKDTAVVYLDKPTALRLANKILELFND